LPQSINHSINQQSFNEEIQSWQNATMIAHRIAM